MSKTFLKQEVKDRINAKLREVLVIRQDGQCEYPAGWDDTAIATVVGGTATEISIKRLRQANFGRLFKGPADSNKGSREIIAELQKDVRALKEWATQMDPSWNKVKL